MSILKAPPKQPKNATLQLRVDEELKLKLDKYAEVPGVNGSVRRFRSPQTCIQ